MSSENRKYLFFVAAALVFWNPATFYILYSRKIVYEVAVVQSFYWTIFLVGLASIYFVFTGRAGWRFKKVANVLSIITICFSCLVVVNVVIGRVKKARNKTVRYVNGDDRRGGLVFEPNAKEHYRTSEFSFDLNTNSLGLRNPEVSRDKGNKFRIMCFGDSWTMGQSVQEAEAWPRKLEEYLHNAGMTNVEVINCGRGGQYTSTYKKFMADAVPMLKPDLVLLGVLQEDDLAQLYEYNYKTGDSVIVASRKRIVPQGAKHGWSLFIEGSIGHILQFFYNPPPPPKPPLTEINKQLANDFYKSLDETAKLRFYALDDSMKWMFFSGNVNPGLVAMYITFPDRVAIFNNPAHPATQFALGEMKKDVAEMKEVCEKNNASLVFISMPINYFIGHKVLRCPNDVLNPFFETHNMMDSMYASVASHCGLPYIQLTEHFRALPQKEGYFFKFDIHPTARGQAEMATCIGSQLMARGMLKAGSALLPGSHVGDRQ